ncbi:MAG: DUF1015 domain-containing protein [Nitrospinales bacterium]
MVDVIPFAGILYDEEKIDSYANVTAPPYDVIKPKQQDELYAKNPHNIVRLILGHIFPNDNEGNNRYTRSAKDFKKWLENGVLARDEIPGFYVYSQEYEFNGDRVNRIGFFGRVKLEDFSEGNICPHEFTLAKAKKDRTQLLKECKANFSPIFGLFSDPDGIIDTRLLAVAEKKPLAEIETEGVTHKLWRLDDPRVIDIISNQMMEKKVYIADGHHRYETALAYNKEYGDQVTDSAHVLMFLTNLDSESLSIYPIHRQVKCPDQFNRDQFLEKISEFFEVEEIPQGASANQIRNTLKDQEGIVFGVNFGVSDSKLLRLRDTKNIIPYQTAEEPSELQELGVAQLHTLVLKHILGIDTKNPDSQNYISYTVNIDEAMRNVEEGKFDLAFFINPTPISQVRSLAENGIRLPQKATYFYPKLLSGLVINKFES